MIRSFVVLAFLRCVSAVGQTTAAISGTVFDPAGAVVPGVKIILKNADRGASLATSTDREGNYKFPAVDPGAYELSAEHAGFSTEVMSGIVLPVGGSLRQNLILRIGPANETVTVFESSPLVDKSNPELSTVVGQQVIESLPNIGRNFVDLTKLSSAVTQGKENLGGGAFKEPDAGVGQGAAPRLSFAGQPELNNMVLVDGAINVQTFTGLPQATPSQESIQEFRILNNTYASELGSAFGGFINIVTKSGTNNYHGTAYYFGMNQALNRTYMLDVPNPRLQQNQYGFNLGGPIAKDKTFFFLNYEGQRRAQTNQYSTVVLSNLAGINATKSFFGLAPENLGLLHTNDYDGILAKVDHNQGNHEVFLRFNGIKAKSNGFLGNSGRGASTPSSARSNQLVDQSVVGRVATFFGSDTLNEAHLQWARRDFNFPSLLKEPDLEVPDLLFTGKSSTDGDFYREIRVQASDSLSLIRGKHQIKLGAEVNYLLDTYQWDLYFPARVIFPDLTSFLGQGIQMPGGPVPVNGPGVPIPLVFWWPYLNGTSQRQAVPVPFTQDVPNSLTALTTSGINHGAYGFFAQDQWQATNKVTLTYGLRYDFETYPSQYVVNAPHNGIQPRAGFAYALGPHTVVRAGGGILDGRLYSSIAQSLVAGQWVSQGNLPNAQLLAQSFGYSGLAPLTGRFPDAVRIASLPGAGFAGILNDVRTFTATGRVPCINPLFNPTTACPPGTPPSFAPFFSANPISSFKIPYSVQASAKISHEFGGGVVLSASYLYLHAIHQGAISGSLNVVPTGTFDGGKVCFALGGPMNGFCNSGRTPAARRFLDLGNLFLAIDSGGMAVYHGGTAEIEKHFSHGFSLLGSYTYSRTISDYESVASIADSPQSQNRGLERAASRQSIPQRLVLALVSEIPRQVRVFHDFRFSALLNAQSGGFYNIFAGQDFNDDGNPLSDRPGVLPRNTLQGQGMFSWDMRIARAAHWREHLSGEFTFDLFNVTNRVNISNLNSVCECDDPGLLVKPNALNPLFGFNTARSTLNPFQFQYGFKLRF